MQNNRIGRALLSLALALMLLITPGMAACADAPELPQVETVTADGFSMDYIRFGQGENTLVILPGLSVQSVMGSAAAIAEAYRSMADDYTVYLFDRRKELPEAYSISGMAQDTAEAMELLGLRQVDLFGASQGGMIAMKIAAGHPELVRKLALGSTAARIEEENFHTIENWIGLAKAGDAEGLYLAFGRALYPEEQFTLYHDALTAAAQTVTEDDLARFVILAECIRGFDCSGDLEKIECPVLVTGSMTDQVLGADASFRIAEQLSGRKDAELFMYGAYGHACFDIAPDYKDRLLEFFAPNASDPPVLPSS